MMFFLTTWKVDLEKKIAKFSKTLFTKENGKKISSDGNLVYI
jgi:hypothetical protein